jgi:hypothetical protein
MYITAVPNRNSPPAILLRESYRESGKVKNRTLANLSSWPPAQVEALRQVLRGNASVSPPLEEAFDIIRSRPHGHVAAVVGSVRRTGLERVLGSKPSPNRELSVAMIAARLLAPSSKLATTRALGTDTGDSTLGEVLGVESATEYELYEAMDWLLAQQPRIEGALAKRHLAEGSLVLYDVTSTYFEGRQCSLAKLGHSRDGKKDRPQIVFGLLTSEDGCPVAVEVFEGNTGDPKTLAPQVKKLRERFGMKRLVLVGDRGMITDARIREDLVGVEGLDWITALRAPAIQSLVKGGALQLSLFDKLDLAEISSPDYPGERLIVCKNPLLAEERARKRRELLDATERELRKVAEATTRTRRPLRGKDRIAWRVGKVEGRHKMGKHFRTEITDKSFRFERDEKSIAAEAALDGFYVVRTSVGAERLSAKDAVRSYKRLANVERAFRSIKTVDIEVRPIHHRKADRVRAHVFLCMLAYYVEWHMRRALATMLFDDHDKAAGEAARGSVVAPAHRSPAALEKAQLKQTADGEPVHDFHSLLRDLATVCKNRVQPKAKGAAAFDMTTLPTPLQKRAFGLLQVEPRM